MNLKPPSESVAGFVEAVESAAEVSRRNPHSLPSAVIETYTEGYKRNLIRRLRNLGL